jgi:tetratricopeptide (TPR) repeat protein
MTIYWSTCAPVRWSYFLVQALQLATTPEGKPIPAGEQLGALIAKDFLGGKYAERDFKTICDFAINRKSVRELQEYIHDTLLPFQPAQFHYLIPQFIWSGIVTTNYDLVVERAYDGCKTPLQHLAPFRSDADVPADGFKPSSLQYVKLHGCLTEYQKTDPPLIASTDQIIEHITGRAAQFQQFLEWANTRTIVFAGYRADDANLRTLINQIAREGEKHPRHYIVRPDVDTIEADYWEARRFRSISSTFDGFLKTLDSIIPDHARKLASVGAPVTKTAFSKFISVSGRNESRQLTEYMSSDCEHVSVDTSAGEGNATRFFNGFDLGWFPIQNNLDVSRAITRSILQEQIVSTSDNTAPRLIALRAHAGAGKSVILRRLAWDAAKAHERLVFYLNKHGRIDLERFDEIFSLTNKAVFLIVDNAAFFAAAIERLFSRATAKKWPLVIICGERLNEWNVSCEALEADVQKDYIFRYLSKSEIENLVRKLEQSDCLGHLASIPQSERSKHLQEQFGRQLLVALHEATKNANFRDIVANEYRRINPAEARLLYLDICALNRYGTPVRAGLIARVHGISFEEFKKKFFEPLEEVVDITMDSRTGDYTYQARHPLIAEWVYSSSLVTLQERYDNFIRILGKLNSTYSYDREVLSHLTRGYALAELFPDRAMATTIYTTAISTFGETAPLYHQWGLYEMNKAGDLSDLDRAQGLIERALAIEPKNKAIQHSFAELALKRSRIAENVNERESWRQEAMSLASGLMPGAYNSYAHHTMAKAATDAVADALRRYEENDVELSELALDEAIKQADDILRRALQRFPNDDRLLTSEAELGKVLNNADRALTALKKAFAHNPRSELVARRLAKVQRAKNDLPGAIETLRQALGYSSGSAPLNYDMATCLRESEPDADQKNSDAILYHYSRAFSPADKNYDARFWHARQLWIKGQETDARKVYQTLKNSKLPYRLRSKLQGPVLDHAGAKQRFSGQISILHESHGFIRMDGRSVLIYFGIDPDEDSTWLEETQRVTFSLAFNLLGPCAVDIEPLLI